MRRDLVMQLIGVFVAVGFADSAYLTYLSSTPPTSCPVGDFNVFSCNEILWSRYSHVFGISVAFLGLGWFVISAILTGLAWRDKRYMFAVAAWSFIGAIGVAMFIYTEVFLLRSICLLCTVAHISALTILVLSIANIRKPH